ncbi:MAG TPA: hypothetical protein VGS19_04870 [Streptosporangiaceae bacterium]|nr:hypothetical protein [Streptosporangiaceae bacterium]
MTGGWRDAAAELVIAAVAVAALITFTVAYAGTAAAVVTLVVCGLAALTAIRFLAWPRDTTRGTAPAGGDSQTTFTGFWRNRTEVETGTRTLSGYDAQLRATLQHVLATRLAERHGVSLYSDPATAQRLLAVDDRTWFWLDPARPAVTRTAQAGIRPKTLALILDRLERL